MAISEERLTALLAYCKLLELRDDPEVQMTIPVLYASAVGYLAGAGVSEPPEGTDRRAIFDLVVNYLVLDAYDQRKLSVSEASLKENPVYRNMMNQLKWTEPVDVSKSDTNICGK